MTTDRRTFVIVGASLAGAKAAETLRAAGFDGRVVLVGEEPDRPYERPALSKTFLRAESSVDNAFVHAPTFYSDHDIELWLDTMVESVDVRERAVRFDDGVKLQYDAVLLATGSRPRGLRVPGADLPGIHYLRTLRDAQVLSFPISGSVYLPDEPSL